MDRMYFTPQLVAMLLHYQWQFGGVLYFPWGSYLFQVGEEGALAIDNKIVNAEYSGF